MKTQIIALLTFLILPPSLLAVGGGDSSFTEEQTARYCAQFEVVTQSGEGVVYNEHCGFVKGVAVSTSTPASTSTISSTTTVTHTAQVEKETFLDRFFKWFMDLF